MAYGSWTTLEDATDAVLNALGAIKGQGGLIVVDRSGNLCMPFTTDGMYRGYARGAEAPHMAIRRESSTPCAFSPKKGRIIAVRICVRSASCSRNRLLKLSMSATT